MEAVIPVSVMSLASTSSTTTLGEVIFASSKTTSGCFGGGILGILRGEIELDEADLGIVYGVGTVDGCLGGGEGKTIEISKYRRWSRSKKCGLRSSSLLPESSARNHHAMPVDLWSQQYPPCSASDPTSFAYSSTVTRWPTIVTSIIDHLANLNGTTNLSEEGAKDKVEQGKEIIRELAGLIYEMRHDRALTDIKGE